MKNKSQLKCTSLSIRSQSEKAIYDKIPTLQYSEKEKKLWRQKKVHCLLGAQMKEMNR